MQSPEHLDANPNISHLLSGSLPGGICSARRRGNGK
jgi:hypothetical protein